MRTFCRKCGGTGRKLRPYSTKLNKAYPVKTSIGDGTVISNSVHIAGKESRRRGDEQSRGSAYDGRLQKLH